VCLDTATTKKWRRKPGGRPDRTASAFPSKPLDRDNPLAAFGECLGMGIRGNPNQLAGHID
jgi:hypothetical protein